MPDPELVSLVERSLTPDTMDEFQRRVDLQADAVREAFAAGRFENDAFTLGLELEAYAVHDDGRLAKLPETVFETPGCNKELGLQNVELNVSPDTFDADGLEAQARQLQVHVERAAAAVAGEELDLVLDAMWTIPPAEGTRAYLSETEIEDGVVVATNMRRSPRYTAIDNDLLERAGGGIDLVLPGIRHRFPTILVESLATSIQPHLQIPDLETFPTYYTVAIRTMGPVLALATNSPFLPADLYEFGNDEFHVDDDPSHDPGYGGSTLTWDRDGASDPYSIVDGTYHELRIPVFEQAINVDGVRKVRFPRDIDRPEDVIDRLEADQTCAPFLKEWVKEADVVDEYADRIWELEHKRGTYWRWLRSVAGGQALRGVSERSLRIEYRPIPTQPSVADVIGFQSLVVGLVHGLVVGDHPIASLEWETARDNFYGAVEDGLDADFAWIDATGERTASSAAVYEDVFEYARRGLHEQGLSSTAIDEFLAPVESRWEARTTPSIWKMDAVRERLDSGADLRAAIEGMQRDYIRHARSGDPFVEW